MMVQICRVAPSLLTVHTILKIFCLSFCMKGQRWKHIVQRKESEWAWDDGIRNCEGSMAIYRENLWGMSA